MRTLPRGPEFRLFGSLPAELRIKIWKFCLPHRVAEINHPRWLGQGKTCKGGWTSKQNNKPPAIAYVNWEARHVALKSAREGSAIGPENEFHPTWGSWFQKDLDSVLLYRPDDGEEVSSSLLIDYRFSEGLLKELKNNSYGTAIRTGKSSATELRLTEFESDEGMQSAPKNGWDEPMIVMEAVTIHAKKEDVLAAQLFGKLADEPIQLVDPFDGELLDEYRQLAVKSRVPQSTLTSEFFDSHTGGENRAKLFRQSVRVWIEECRARELWPKWQLARAQGFQGIPRPETIWSRRAVGPTVDMLDEDALIQGSLDGGINVTRFGVNEMHPWVRANLVRTGFTPRILIRWCGKTCWRPGTHWMSEE